jgi:hypothetical protein
VRDARTLPSHLLELYVASPICELRFEYQTQYYPNHAAAQTLIHIVTSLPNVSVVLSVWSERGEP